MEKRHVPNKITVHCSATPNGKSVSLETIKKWHTDPPPAGRGWSDIGYHVLIDVDGSIHNGRPLNIVGAHVSGENKGNIGICLVGTDKYHVEQLEAMRQQIENLCRIYSIPKWELRVHNQFKSAIEQGKSCPGFSVNELLGFMWIDSKALKGVEL